MDTPALPSTVSSLADARVTVMGLGRFGGGVGVARWLLNQGARVTITDLSSEDDLRDSLAELSDVPADQTPRLHLGSHAMDDFTSADLIIVNPAVPKPWENPYLAAARDAGVPRTTEIRLLIERLDRTRIVGVTGSAGKSTTAAMIHHILTHTGHASRLGGNMGGSLLPLVSEINSDEFIVLELSSAMLYWLGESIGYDGAAGWSPHVGVLTNIAQNHLDWHGTFEHYVASKQNIFAFQQAGDHQIRGEDFKQRRELPLAIPGKHNQLNGMLALTAALRLANIAPSDAAQALATFTGLPHRLEHIATRGSQQFYNDSKSTVPEATVLAVNAFSKPSKVHVIVGGYDKQLDLSPIAALGPRVAGLYGIGSTSPLIEQRAPAGTFHACGTLEVAVERAMAAMDEDHILLLSPGCASWDQFENYERRGDRFRQLLAERLDEAAGPRG